MPPITPTTYQADEHLAAYLLSLNFIETTSSAYHQARGWRSFYHAERWLSVWLKPGTITLQAGAHWRFEAQGPVLAETLAFLLATEVAPVAAPTASRPRPLLPELGYRHSIDGPGHRVEPAPTAGQLPRLASA